MKRFDASVIAVCLAVGAARAQTPSTEFEVATVKLKPPPALGALVGINLGTYRNGSLTMNNITLSEALLFAYDLASEDQISGPDWIKSRNTMYEVVARTGADVDLARARVMTKKLLIERLKLVVRNEARPVSFAALVQAKEGSKLVPGELPQTGPPQTNFGPGRIAGSSVPMPVLALLLSRFERQLILDRTGLTGRYQLNLEYLSEGVPGGGDPSKPSLSAALQEQLGLRLESRREPLDTIVVDRAEKIPTDN